MSFELPSGNTPEYQQLHRRAQSMFQVNFSDQSMQELNKMPVEEQLKLVDRISNITSEQLSNLDEALGKFNRNGMTYYRVRVGDLRCYFEIKEDTLFSHYILHRNTIADFAYRNKLPVTQETMTEETNSFWKYIESLKH